MTLLRRDECLFSCERLTAVLLLISFQDGCYKNCPVKTYSVEEEMTCVPCDDNCVSCDEHECYWCETDLFLLGKTAPLHHHHHQFSFYIFCGYIDDSGLMFNISQYIVFSCFPSFLGYWKPAYCRNILASSCKGVLFNFCTATFLLHKASLYFFHHQSQHSHKVSFTGVSACL